MAEYIERETVIENLIDLAGHEDNWRSSVILGVVNTLRRIPAADVAPVVHGHWNVRCDSHHDTYTGETDETFYLECSECKRKVWDVNQMAAMNGDYGKMIADFPYCHCGAKMTLEMPKEVHRE